MLKNGTLQIYNPNAGHTLGDVANLKVFSWLLFESTISWTSTVLSHLQSMALAIFQSDHMIEIGIDLTTKKYI